MNVPASAWIKMITLVVVGVVFGGGMIFYSHSRAGVMGDAETHEGLAAMFSTGDKSERHLEKTFTVNEGDNLDVESDGGDITVESWDKDEVDVKVDISGSERRVEQFDVDFSQQGNLVSVTGKSDENNFFRWGGQNLTVKFQIMVPKKFNLRGSTSGGNIAISDVQGQVRFETSGGDVQAQSIVGTTDLSTSGGDVHLTDITGKVKTETSGGDIECENITGDLNAGTSGGNLKLTSIQGNIRGETSGGTITARLKGENKGMELHSSGGTIYIYVDESIKADIDASSSGGKVTCDMPITIQGDIDESELHGKINGGGPVIHAETSGGDVKILSQK
jgi:hypothetical protein